MARRRSLLIVVAVFLARAMAIALPPARVAILQTAGQTLVAEEQAIASAEVIIVAVDAGSAGVLEAADLVKNGVATRVAVFAPGMGKVDAELVRRGLPYEDPMELRLRQLEALGVQGVMPLPRVAGTEEQGRVLADWCDQHGVRSVLVVTSWYHSRRVVRVLQRALKDRDTTVQVRVTRYADFEPDNWWRTRAGARSGITELQKLLWDLVRHPLS